MVGVVAVVIGLLLVAVALVGGEDGGDPAPEPSARTPLPGFGEVAVTVTSGSGEVCELCLLAATDTEQRARGLMEVTDPALGGYDGMLFEYPESVDGQFYMRNTPMPLSIAFFDDAGVLVSTTDMAPCADVPDCPTYPADAPFSFALEVPQGLLDDVGVTGTATLRVGARTCPVAG